MSEYPRTVLEFRDWFADDAACRAASRWASSEVKARSRLCSVDFRVSMAQRRTLEIGPFIPRYTRYRVSRVC